MIKKVSIIILNWNGLNDTLECLDTVYRLDYPCFEVIVVDNGSSDDSVVNIRRKFPQAILIENGKNLGFTGGNNVAMRHAMESGADYVWLLNNDTVVEPGTLGTLVEEGEMSPETGLVSPVVRYYDNPDKIQFEGSYVDFLNLSLNHVMNSKELDNEEVQRNLIVWGTALLIKRSVIESIGYLSDRYFAYAEDTDYCLRARRKNFRARVARDASILHKVSRSIGNKSPAQIFLRTRNAYFVWRDNVYGIRRLFVPIHYVGMAINFARLLSHEHNEKGFDACLDGFWAALRGRGGAYDPATTAPPWLKPAFNFFVTWHPYFWINLFKCNMKAIVFAACRRTGLI